jgi:hypothetical protein
METRTVTQFHFLTWGELNNPPSAKSLLDFRRYVYKSFLFFYKEKRKHTPNNHAILIHLIKINEKEGTYCI